MAREQPRWKRSSTNVDWCSKFISAYELMGMRDRAVAAVVRTVGSSRRQLCRQPGGIEL